MICTVYWYEEKETLETTLNFYADDQRWDKKTLKELREKYNIFFMHAGDGVVPVMLVSHDREEDGKKVRYYEYVFGGEDDGHIWFTKYSYSDQWKYSVYETWVDAMLCDLSAARAEVQNARIFGIDLECDPMKFKEK